MVSTTPRRAVITAAGIIVLCALLVRDASQPPSPLASSAPPTEFSAERALAHVREIAQRPHPAGSPDNARVREYLLVQLRALGLQPQVQEATGVGTRYPRAGLVRNVVARMPGRTPGGLAVVLMAHYDGVAGGPAAGDDGAGTAAVLETLRALRAGTPLAHDVIALITDGEEAGLLGAAAFVREHPWAKDVGVTLNVEGRGTTGRSRMFETGPGNLDVARVLRGVGEVSATSLSVTVYRSLPNDTDLSELAVLGKPALNFAFVDGVERYHTAYDDVANLDPGSLQHHGSQMLALARAFGDGPLPRPVTGDAVFFDLPVVGLIVYPEAWAWPITLAAVALVLATLLRGGRGTPRFGRDTLIGAVATLVSTACAGALAMMTGSAIARVHTAMGWGGAPAFRAVYTAALAVLALTVALAIWAIVRRWASVAGAHAGALVVWALLAVAVTWKLPGVSFVFVWPLLAGTLAAGAIMRGPSRSGTNPMSEVGAEVALWVGTVVAAALIVPIVYAVSAVMLGAVGPGGIAAGALVSLLAWLLAPQMEALGAGRRWLTVGVALAATAAVTAIGMTTVRSSPRHPTPSVIVYALDADSANAWLGTLGPSAKLISPPAASDAQPPRWLRRAFGGGRSMTYRQAPKVTVDPPVVTVIADSSTDAERRLVLRIRAAPGTETIGMRANKTRVLGATIDGRAIDTSRYRGNAESWSLDYAAPPDSGITLALTVPARSSVSLDLLTSSRGIAPLAGITFRPRPSDVVTVQMGDVTVVHRTVRVED
jgi:hypothetical protein